MHYFIGDLGHLFVITSFITALATTYAYFKATTVSALDQKRLWTQNGKTGFYVHAIAVLGICVTLFVIISGHYFEYHYAYNYSDKKLPAYYLISTFWNGQEGSFMLWMFWQAVLGIIVINTNKFWEAPVMTVFALVQAFLASMILGVVIPGLDIEDWKFTFHSAARRHARGTNLHRATRIYPQGRKWVEPSIAELLDGDSSADAILGICNNLSSFFILHGRIVVKKIP